MRTGYVILFTFPEVRKLESDLSILLLRRVNPLSLKFVLINDFKRDKFLC